jgi:hypothetical protein
LQPDDRRHQIEIKEFLECRSLYKSATSQPNHPKFREKQKKINWLMHHKQNLLKFSLFILALRKTIKKAKKESVQKIKKTVPSLQKEKNVKILLFFNDETVVCSI